MFLSKICTYLFFSHNFTIGTSTKNTYIAEYSNSSECTVRSNQESPMSAGTPQATLATCRDDIRLFSSDKMDCDSQAVSWNDQYTSNGMLVE